MAKPPNDHDDGVRLFLDYLTRARSAAWNPSAQWLSRHSGIPKTTVESLIHGTRKRLPNWSEQVERLLEAYRKKVTEDRRGDPDGYLSDEQWNLLDDDWVERAFSYLTDHRPCRGARPPLTRIKPRPGTGHAPAAHGEGEPAYSLADYLEQHGARTRRFLCPSATFWNAATRRAASVSDHRALAQAARDRGRYRHASALYQAVADAGDTSVLRELGWNRKEAGDHEGAERFAQAAVDAGDTAALHDLAERRVQEGKGGRWANLARFGLEADGSAAGPW